MNREAHLLSGLVWLVIIETVFLIWLMRDHGTLSLISAATFSIVFYIVGIGLPDLDHEKVQRGPFKLLRYCTKHRGHFHSILALLIYSFVVFLLVFFVFQLVFWYYPVICAGLGFWSHLLADDANRWKLKVKPTRAIKIW